MQKNWNGAIFLKIGKSQSFHFSSAKSDSSKILRTKGLQKIYDVNNNFRLNSVKQYIGSKYRLRCFDNMAFWPFMSAFQIDQAIDLDEERTPKTAAIFVYWRCYA